MTGDLVVVHSGARRAWPFLPPAAPPGTVWVGPTGEFVLVLADGRADEIGEERRRGAAADPCAEPARRAA